tara:strand:- start:237 stop:740 length:504 start_codon:yes stop_codon:yes gene_type:complete
MFTDTTLMRIPYINYKITTDHPYLFGYINDNSGGFLVNQSGIYMGTFVVKTSDKSNIGFSILKDISTNNQNLTPRVSHNYNDNTDSGIEYLYKDDSLSWSQTEPSKYSEISFSDKTIFKNSFIFSLDEPSILMVKVSSSNNVLLNIQLRITAMSFWDPSEITEKTIS